MRNLIPHFISEKYSSNECEGSFKASTLFLDISGFTAMTESLMREGKEGAEILSEIINKIFEPVISSIYSSGGFISTFAGDAFTVIFFDKIEPLQAVSCAEEIINIFKVTGTQETKYGVYELKVKLGMSHGDVQFGIIGNENQKAYYFKGEAVDGCAVSEHLCGTMEVILDENIFKLIPVEKVKISRIGTDHFKVVEFNDGTKRSELKKQGEINREVLSRFVPNQVLDLDQHGEFREIVPAFISVKESGNECELKENISNIILQCNSQGGYFNKIDFGDKGCVLLAVFGAPVSYENNVIRAINFINNVKNVVGVNFRAGITAGIAYAGFIGSEQRSEYTVFGDIVNQAARFMMKAEWGEILLSGTTAHRVSRSFITTDLGKMNFKGKSEPVAVYKLEKKKDNQEDSFFTGEMVGRKSELKILSDNAEEISQGKFAGITTVYGEAGMGKSRLVYEFTGNMKETQVLLLQTESILKLSLNPFKYFFRNYFGDNFESIFDTFLNKLRNSSDGRAQAIVTELERTRSVIASLINVYYENSLYEKLDSKARFENTLYAIKEFIKGLSLINPVIIQIEDIHWIDDDSQKAFRVLCRGMDDYPVMVVATSRFNDDGTKPVLQADREVKNQEIVLGKLEHSSAVSYIELLLGGTGEEDLIELLREKSEYNPFFIEQIVHYLKENSLVEFRNGRYFLKNKSIDIPGNISTVIIARIDRLENKLKNIIQVASVCGREVELKVLLAMLEYYSSVHTAEEVRPLLEKIEDEQLWNNFAEIKYIFKHALLHEAVYEMQLRSRLRELHALAARSINLIHIGKEEKYYETARHFDKAELSADAVNYYRKAGEWFKKNYENTKAVECYDKLIGFLKRETDIPELIDVMNSKGTVLDLTGNWVEAEKMFSLAAELSEKINDKIKMIESRNNLAGVKRNLGELNDAMGILKSSLELAEKIDDKQGISGSLQGQGEIYFDLGNYVSAMECFTKRLEISEKLGKRRDVAASTNNLGVIFYTQGKYTEAMECYKKVMAIFEELNEKHNVSNILNNMGNIYRLQGDYTNAMECYGRAMKAAIESGDKKSISSVSGNLGIAYYEQGNSVKALEYLKKQHDEAVELGDKHGVGNALGTIGSVYSDSGDLEMAIQYFSKKLTLSEELGDRHSISSAIGNIGVIYNKQHEFQKAMECYDKQLKISVEIGDKRSESFVYGNLGNVYYNQGDYGKANEYYRKQLQLAIELGDKKGAISVAVNTGNVFFQQGDYSKAEEYYRQGLETAEELGDKKFILIISGNMGEVLGKLGEYEAANRSYDKAIGISREFNIKPYLCNFLQAKSDLLYKIKDYNNCRAINDEAHQIAKELNDPGQIFNSELMECKLAAQEDQDKAVGTLTGMIGKESEEVNRAVLSYEIWQINKSEEHKTVALELFKKLYEGSENFDYKAIIDELEK
ncbi:MAG: tetratricopeptide repeat protein [Candidatus Delongbacteria bacterium]